MDRGGPTSLLAVAAVTVVLALVWPLLAQVSWGSRSYEEEWPEYIAIVGRLDKERKRLEREKVGAQKRIDEYLESFWGFQREGIRDAARRHESVRIQQRLLDAPRERELQARNLYEDHKALRPDERQGFVRARYWPKHVEWLQAKVALLAREVEALDTELVAMQAQTTTLWSAFREEVAEDVAFAIKEVLGAFVGDVVSCFENLFVDSLARAVGQVPAGTLDPGFAPEAVWGSQPLTLGGFMEVGQACVAGPARDAIVHGFAAAWKKEFMDDLEATHQVLPEVAAHWWDHHVAVELPKDRPLLQRVRERVLSPDAIGNAVRQHVDEAAIRRLAADQMPDLERQFAGVVARTRDPEAVRRTMRGIARSRAEDALSESGRLGPVVAGIELGVKVTAQLMQMSANSEVFLEIENNEVERYRRIVACLRERREPIAAPAIIEKLELDGRAYAAFLGQCAQVRAAAAPTPDPQPTPDRARLDALLERLRALVARGRAADQQARAGCAAAETALAGVPANLAQVAARLDAAETAAVPTGSRRDPGAARTLADQAYAEAGRVIEARQRAEAAEATACAAADRAQAASTDPERERWVAAAATAAREAGAQAQVAAAAAARSAAVAGQLVTNPAVPPVAAATAAELAAVESALAGLERELTAARQAAREAAEANDALRLARPEAAALHDEHRVGLEPHRAEAWAGLALREADGLFGQVQTLGDGLGRCAAELPRAITGHLGALEAARARLANLRARAAGPEPAVAGVDDAARDARASADTAEILAEAVAAVAGRAQACAARGAAVAPRPAPPAPPLSDPPPLPASDPQPPAPGPGPAPASGGGWTSGGVTTIAGETAPDADLSPAPATAPPSFGRPDVSGLIAGIRAAKDACNYPGAMGLVAQVDALDPGHPWVEANRALLQRLAAGQASAYAALQRGQAALQANDLAAAEQFAVQAANNAPSCMRASVEGLVGAVGSARATADAQRRAERARVAQEILGGLIGIANTLSGRQGGAPAVPTGGAAAGGSPPFADPCAFQYTFANKYAPTPTCTCAGYEYRGGRCVGQGGATGPGAVDTRSTACGSTSKSGADAPASITVDMGGRTGTAVFSYSMYDVKDRMIVRQGGRALLDTGCVSGSGRVALSVTAFGGPVTVIVQPACEKRGTQWNFTLGCPQ
jgi:hypothetical protein